MTLGVFPLRRAKGRVETEISQGETSKKRECRSIVKVCSTQQTATTSLET